MSPSYDRVIRFDADQRLEGSWVISLEPGADHSGILVQYDIDYVNIILGDGTLELGDRRIALSEGAEIKIPKGNKYTIIAGVDGKLVAQIHQLSQI
ncbi:hypothetical protein ACXPWS_05040 [Mycobacterium sp. BMJ-28]